MPRSETSKSNKSIANKGRKSKRKIQGGASKKWRDYRHLHKQSRHRKLPGTESAAGQGSDDYYMYKRPIEKLLKRVQQFEKFISSERSPSIQELQKKQSAFISLMSIAL